MSGSVSSWFHFSSLENIFICLPVSSLFPPCMYVIRPGDSLWASIYQVVAAVISSPSYFFQNMNAP